MTTEPTIYDTDQRRHITQAELPEGDTIVPVTSILPGDVVRCENLPTAPFLYHVDHVYDDVNGGLEPLVTIEASAHCAQRFGGRLVPNETRRTWNLTDWRNVVRVSPYDNEGNPRLFRHGRYGMAQRVGGEWVSTTIGAGYLTYAAAVHGHPASDDLHPWDRALGSPDVNGSHTITQPAN